MAQRDPQLLLRHVRDCCSQLQRCRELMETAEIPDSIIFDAVCRNIEIIGEAAGKVDPGFRERHAEIPWRKMIAARNILIHNYEGVDPDIVWAIVRTEIPDLLERINQLLPAD